MTTQPTTAEQFVTLEELAKFPKHPRYELVAGALVKLPDVESGVHENTGAIVITRVGNHVYPNNLGSVLSSNYGYVTVKEPPSTCRNADVSFISSARLHQRDLCGMFFDGAPDLAVEILSGYDCDLKLPQKTVEYLAAGGKAVWIIDTDARTLTVHTPDAAPLILTAADTVCGGDYLPGFACAVADLLPTRAD